MEQETASAGSGNDSGQGVDHGRSATSGVAVLVAMLFVWMMMTGRAASAQGTGLGGDYGGVTDSFNAVIPGAQVPQAPIDEGEHMGRGRILSSRTDRTFLFRWSRQTVGIEVGSANTATRVPNDYTDTLGRGGNREMQREFRDAEPS